MKIGDTVRIKTYEEIKADSDEEISYGFYTGTHFFDHSMIPFCECSEKITKIVEKSFGTVYRLDNGWWYLDKWLIPEDFLTDKDFEI